MSDFNNQLLGVLSEIKGTGSFVSTHSRPFLFPGLEIEGLGEIGFPINPLEIKEMIKAAHKAPFGKGSETVIDPAVRSAWEIDATQITFSNSDWSEFIESILEEVKSGLGINENVVSANLYKLLIYEVGDFFLAHKDSEKEQGMFGTLIIGLPSKHTGGKLTVEFDGREEIIDFSEAIDHYKIPFTAFYADCTHEITPVTSGYRVCLIYNLIQNKGEENIQLHKLGDDSERLASILKHCEEDQDIPKIVLLGHQYTPSNFRMDTLKLNDRPKAEALLLAAKKAGFYAKLGLVTSYQSGELEVDFSKNLSGSHRRNRYYSDYEFDYDDRKLTQHGVMGAVYDEAITVEHWMQEGVPPLRNISFVEEDLISAFTMNSGDPIEKQAEGYTGNAGMEMQYWYHYGAVFLWPKKYHYEMLSDLSAENMLEWIAYYTKNWESITANESMLIKRVVEEGLDDNAFKRSTDFSPLALWLIHLNDEKYLTENGLAVLIKYFEQIAADDWIKLFETYSYLRFGPMFVDLGSSGMSSAVNHLLTILNRLGSVSDKYSAFLLDQTDRIPEYLNRLDLSAEREHSVARNILRNVFKLSGPKSGDFVWLKEITAVFTKKLTRKYVNEVLVAITLESGTGLALAYHILGVCKADLAQRVANQPLSPSNWSRPVPAFSGSYTRIWMLLADFLQSPVEQVFDYRKAQPERREMENAIINTTIDLRRETITKGSPHTLRLIKTQDAYERELAKWNTDGVLLKKVMEF